MFIQEQEPTNPSSHAEPSNLLPREMHTNELTHEQPYVEDGLLLRKIIAAAMLLVCTALFVLMVLLPAINAFRGLFGWR